MTLPPLSAAELETRLDASLDPALSARRTTHLAEALALFARAEQDFVLRWTDIIARTNTEMAYLFANQAPEGLRRMGLADIEAWIVQAMDVYDRMGLFPACKVFREVAVFASVGWASPTTHGFGQRMLVGDAHPTTTTATAMRHYL